MKKISHSLITMVVVASMGWIATAQAGICFLVGQQGNCLTGHNLTDNKTCAQLGYSATGGSCCT